MVIERVTFRLKDILPPVVTEGLTKIQEAWDSKPIEDKRLSYGRVLFYRRKRGAAGSNSTLEPEQRQALDRIDKQIEYSPPPAPNSSSYWENRGETFKKRIDPVISSLEENPSYPSQTSSTTRDVPPPEEQLKRLQNVREKVQKGIYSDDPLEARQKGFTEWLRDHNRRRFAVETEASEKDSIEIVMEAAAKRLDAPQDELESEQVSTIPPTPGMRFGLWMYEKGKITDQEASSFEVPENPPLSYLRATNATVPENVEWEIPEGIAELIPPPDPEKSSGQQFHTNSHSGGSRRRGRGRGSGGGKGMDLPSEKNHSTTRAIGRPLG